MYKKIAVIGSGPAGISAAVQLKRYGYDVLLFEKNKVGGLVRNAGLIENYLGFPNGITGLEFAAEVQSHLKRNNIEITYEEVLNIEYDKKFHLKTNNNEYISDILIIASGTSPITVSEPIIENKAAEFVCYEVENILNIKDKRIAVIGAGDAAFDYALSLSKKNNVSIYNRSSQIKALPVLKERAFKNRTISYFENYRLKSAVYNNENSEIEMLFQANEAEKTIKSDFILFAIGRKKNLSFISSSFEKEIEMLQSNKLLYFVGDVNNGICRQISISAGEGIKAGMQIALNAE